MGGMSGKRQRMLYPVKPIVSSRTLKCSMALAMVGESISRSWASWASLSLAAKALLLRRIDRGEADGTPNLDDPRTVEPQLDPHARVRTQLVLALSVERDDADAGCELDRSVGPQRHQLAHADLADETGHDRRGDDAAALAEAEP